jgi:hypothetical protein
MDLLSQDVLILSQVGLATILPFVFYSAYRRNLPTKKSCPYCNEPLPSIRASHDLYEFLVGGWTCGNCATKLTLDLHRR